VTGGLDYSLCLFNDDLSTTHILQLEWHYVSEERIQEDLKGSGRRLL
jgi:hypothetical protein